MSDRDTARVAKEHLRARLAPLGGVNGVGIGRRDGGYVVTVNVTERTTSEQVPVSFEGVPVEVRVTGPVRATADAERAASPARPSVEPSDGDAARP